MHQENTYFANLPVDEIADNLREKVESYYDEIDRNGRLGLWRKVHRYYFAMDEYGRHEASGINSGGEQDELHLLKANHYRNLIQHLHVLVTQQRPSFECRAINTDYKSQVQTILGQNILEYYMREQHLEEHFRYAAEIALTYSEAYVELEWDDEAGDPVAYDELDRPITPGEIHARVYEPIDVIRSTRGDPELAKSWYILRRWESRYELAAQYPDQAEDILNFSDYTVDYKFHYYDYPLTDPEDDEIEEQLPVFTFYHKPTAACPTGRIVRFLGNDTVLDYRDMDYPKLPIVPMIASRQHGTAFGYSVSFDLLAVQEAVDRMYSTILSNQSSFGVQNIWMKPGSDISPLQLASGLNILESDEKPEPLNLTHTPPEIFNFMQGLEQLGEVLSGINSVARGQPEASLQSGAALALVASQAVQFSNGIQAAYTRMIEEYGTLLMNTLQEFATVPRIAAISGKNKRSYVKEFTGEDINAINRVIVDVGNPMARTVAGRIQMAQDMLQAQVISDPDQYIQVVETGRTEPLIDDKRSEQLLIDSENESLREGEPVVATAVDEHVDHIKGHRQVLSDPSARMDPEITQRTLDHIQEHLAALRRTDPALLNVLGQAPIQVAPDGQPLTAPQGQNAPQPNAPGQPGQQPGPTPPGEKVAPPPGATPEMAENMPTMPAPGGPGGGGQ